MRTAVVTVVAVVLFSGCLGVGGPGGTSAPPEDGATDPARTPSPTPAADTAGPASGPTPPPTAVTSPGPGTSAEPSATTPADATRRNTFVYANLTPDQRAAVDAARNRTVEFVPNTSYVDGRFHRADAEPFRNAAYVRKGDRYFEVSFSRMTGDLYATYWVETTTANASDVGNESVVSLGNVSTDVRDEVRRAVENGAYRAPFGKWASLPEPLDELDYVRHEGTYYGITVVVGDYWASELTVEPVE